MKNLPKWRNFAKSGHTDYKTLESSSVYPFKKMPKVFLPNPFPRLAFAMYIRKFIARAARGR